MRWGVVVLCLVACSDGGGIDLEIHSDVTIDRVEVFVGNDYCYDENNVPCQGGVAWAAGQVRPPGETYVMKSAGHGELEQKIATVTFQGDTAVLHLEADRELALTRKIALVGFLADEPKAVAVLVDQRIPAHTGERWVIQLEPADPAHPSFTDAPDLGQAPLRVKTWVRENVGEPDQLSRCLAVQRWNADLEIWDGTFIVPESDTDCDGETLECDPQYANLNQSSTLDKPACVGVSNDATRNLPDVCVVGSTFCVDGSNDDPTCRLGYQECVPAELCDACGAPSGVETCVGDTVRELATSHAECKLEPNAATNLPCTADQSGSSFQLVLPFACTSVQVRPIASPFTVGQALFTAEAAMLEAYVVQQTNPTSCAIRVIWRSGRGEFGQSDWFMFAIHPLDGLPLLVPVRLDFSDGVTCTPRTTDPPACVVTDELRSDSFLRCAGVEPL